MRVVLDTNVLLAGVGTHGMCEDLLASCLNDHEVFASEFIWSEFRKHYVGKFKATDAQAAAVETALRELTQLVEPASIPSGACRDGDDLDVLGTAVAASAEFLVTGDRDLLELRQYQGIAILSPREFFERLRAGNGKAG